MAEYIEREELLLRIDLHGTNKFGMLDEDIRAFVKETPVADVTPVVHGKWEWDTGDIYRCTACNEKAHVKEVMERPYWPYCPYCGAKMDEES